MRRRGEVPRARRVRHAHHDHRGDVVVAGEELHDTGGVVEVCFAIQEVEDGVALRGALVPRRQVDEDAALLIEDGGVQGVIVPSWMGTPSPERPHEKAPETQAERTSTRHP